MSSKAKLDLKEYIKEEAGKLLDGERLLTPAQVCQRLNISKRQLLEITRGENPKGLYLPACRISRKVIRYRLVDVLRFEHEALQKE